jgi:hypothetical protein
MVFRTFQNIFIQMRSDYVGRAWWCGGREILTISLAGGKKKNPTIWLALYRELAVVGIHPESEEPC